MWESFLADYFASVAAGVILAILGLAAYKTYRSTRQSTNVRQDNKMGSNVTNIYNINTTERQTEEITREILKKYDS